MQRTTRLAVFAMVALATLIAGGLTTISAEGGSSSSAVFGHAATFDVTTNGNEVAEIVDATPDGQTLVYTDSATETIGFVDLSDPTDPRPAGALDVGGEPTSVVLTQRYALVAVNTSGGDFDRPSGLLSVIALADREIVKTFPLGGQPDSVAISPDGSHVAVVIENERDEDENGGLIPQAPPGQLVVIETAGRVDWWPMRYVDFSGLDMFAAADPEPEYVDINEWDRAIVSFQENNHLVEVNLTTGWISNEFAAGSVELVGVDATEEELGPQGNGVISLTETIERRREPDAVAWIDRNSFVTANEGDYEDADGNEGGSRGFTIFRTDGRVEYESGTALEYEAIRAGHYPEGRSGNKGTEPESVEVGRFGDRDLLFVGAERANVVGVYDLSGSVPAFVQLLPTGSGPEGLKAIPGRGLFVVASENSEDGAFPSMLTIYQQRSGAASYPQLVSGDDDTGRPLPWVAMSGLAGDPDDSAVLYGVSDSFLAEGAIYTIDVSAEPAVIVGRTVVTDPDGTVRHDLDLEGIAVAPEGGFWVASEGRVAEGSERPNQLLRVSADGVVQFQVGLPDELLAAGATSSGFEGVAVTGDGTTEMVYAVVQRTWPSDDFGAARIARYDVATDEWTFVAYPVDAVESSNGGWVGLSELSLLPDGRFAVIERDNQLGDAAAVKRLYTVNLANAPFAPFDESRSAVVVPKTLVLDLLPVLEANSIWTPDKVEGLGVAADGTVYVVTDNDGLDDALGQTLFVDLGPADALGGG